MLVAKRGSVRNKLFPLFPVCCSAISSESCWLVSALLTCCSQFHHLHCSYYSQLLSFDLFPPSIDGILVAQNFPKSTPVSSSSGPGAGLCVLRSSIFVISRFRSILVDLSTVLTALCSSSILLGGCYPCVMQVELRNIKPKEQVLVSSMLRCFSLLHWFEICEE